MTLSAESIAPWLSPWMLGILGLCLGSFLNVVIHRLPQMMERNWKRESAELLGLPVPVDIAAAVPLGLMKPRSRCPSCGHMIRWFENIPVISWAVLRGRCSACRARIGIRYPLVELATGLSFAAVAWHMGPQPVVLAWCGFVAVLITLSGIDWDTTLLPDSLTLGLLWGGLVAALLGWTLPIPTALWGAVFGYLSLWSVYWVFKLTTGKDGMGAGDFKLLAALGAWLGWQMLLPIVLAASLIGAIVGIGLKLTGGLHEGRYVPFGPFLAGAGLVVMFAGADRVTAWLGWA